MARFAALYFRARKGIPLERERREYERGAILVLKNQYSRKLSSDLASKSEHELSIFIPKKR